MNKPIKAAIAAVCALACVAQARAQAPSDQSLAGAQQRILSRQDANQRLGAEVGEHMGGLVVALIHHLEAKGIKFADMKQVIASDNFGLYQSVLLEGRDDSYPMLYRLQNKTVNFLMIGELGVASAFQPQGGETVAWKTKVIAGNTSAECILHISFSTYDLASPTYNCLSFIHGDDDAAMRLLFKQAVADSLGVKTPLQPQQQVAPVPLSPKVQHVLAGLRAHQEKR